MGLISSYGITWTKSRQRYNDQRDELYLVQFMMTLEDDFESLLRSILHCTPLPNVDLVVKKLLEK